MAEHNPAATPGLRRNTLGTGDIAFFVVSAAAPLTIMAGIARFAILSGGIGAPAAYLFAGLALAVFAVGFTTMSRHVTNGGAFYAYISRPPSPGPYATWPRTGCRPRPTPSATPGSATSWTPWRA